MNEDLRPAKRALLALIGGKSPALVPTARQWRLIEEGSAAHRLGPLLAWRSERERWSVPEDIAGRWRVARRNSALVALAQQSALRLALDRLSANGIPAVALKGVPLAWHHYPEPGLRPMRDLDLLVPAGQAAQAFDVLKQAGFAGSAATQAAIADALDYDHQLPALDHSGTGVTIELHHRLVDPPGRRGYRLPCLDPQPVIARSAAIDCGGARVRCPDPVDLFAHLVVHAVYGHRLDCGPLVLADLHFLAAAADPVRLRSAAHAGEWSAGLDLMLALTGRWFGPTGHAFAAPPDPILAAAEDALLADPEGRGRAEAAADFAAPFPTAVGRAAARRLVPDPQVVARERGRLPSWAFWPLWAARRGARALRRTADRRIAAEARSAAQVIRWLDRAANRDPAEFSAD